MIRSRCLAVLGIFFNLKSAYAAPADIPSAASFYVPSLPDIHQDPQNPLTIFAGHLPIRPKCVHGGPGCSSFDGLMMEVGPWRMDGKGGFKVAEGGWEEYTTMVYVDQPAGTGFSYTSTDRFVHTLEEASSQFIEFMRNFYKVFPEYQHILAAKSYAGQWIPYFADAILNSNIGTHLRGVAIGNGMDRRASAPWKKAKVRTDECMAEIAKITSPEPITAPKCEGLLLDVTAVREKVVNGKNMCINIYDVRLDDTMPACGMNWPPDIKPVTTYLDRKDVVTALHADAHPGAWIECRGRVHQEMHERLSDSAIKVLPKVLERIPMMQAMEWNGAKGLGKVQTESWSVSGAPAGTWVSSRNLTYAKIFNASHMAPFDVPHISHDMILRFMGVNFSAIFEGSARIPSSIGAATKPHFLEEVPTAAATVAPETGKSPQQAKAMWEAYYNAGSAALVLTLIFAIIGIFVWCRRRKQRSPRLPVNQHGEDIPLNRAQLDEDAAPPIFDVGDSDEEYKDAD
ncbi:Alpha/Beta hydrolase protein [Mycena olivaceomarginata]|nr:Alpha/Beta hydrolase protein [Mycena olivaceomarginata]